MNVPPLPNDATGNEVMWKHVERLRALLATDHEEQGLIAPNAKIRPYRFYMVGKLIRQDYTGKDEGYRETLVCPCHLKALADNTYLKIFGPLRTRPRYSAHCPIDGEQIAEADTMEELWSIVESKRDSSSAGLQTVTAAVQEESPTGSFPGITGS